MGGGVIIRKNLVPINRTRKEKIQMKINLSRNLGSIDLYINRMWRIDSG